MVMGGLGAGILGGVIGRAVIEIVADSSNVDVALSGTQRMLAGALVAGFSASVVAATTYETAMARVEKVTGANERQMARLNAQFIEQSRTIPMTAHELAGLGATAAQLGVQVEDIDTFTEVIAKLGTATNIVGEQGAQDLARFINVAGETTAQAGRIASAIVELGNNSATTEQEILDMSLRIAAAGRQLGLTTGDTLGLAAAMSSLGLRAEAGGTAASRIMLDIFAAAKKGGPELQQFADVAQMTSQEFLRLVETSPVEAITAFIVGLGSAEERGLNVVQMLDDLSLGNVRVRDTLLRLAGAQDLMNNSIAIGNRAYEENNALQKEFEVFSATLSNQLKLLRNDVMALAITSGQSLLPTFKVLVEVARMAVGVFADLPGPVQTFLVAGIATVTLLPLLTRGFALLTTQILALNVAMLANPVTAAVMVAGLVVTGVALSTVTRNAREASAETERLAQVQKESASRSVESLQGEMRQLFDRRAELERQRAEQEALAASINPMLPAYREAADEVERLDRQIAAVTSRMGVLNEAINVVSVRQSEQARAARESAEAAEEQARALGLTKTEADAAAEALLALNPRMIAVTWAARLLATGAFELHIAIHEVAEASRQVAELEGLAQDIMKAAGMPMDDAKQARTEVEKLADRFAEFAARAPRSMAEVRAELELYRAEAQRAGDTTALALIDNLLRLDPTVQHVRGAIAALQAQYGDLAGASEQSARRQQEALRQVEQALAAVRADAERGVDTLGQVLTTALRRQHEAALEGQLAGVQRLRDALEAQHNEAIAAIRRERDARVAAVDDQIAALQRQAADARLQDLRDQLALATDPREQKRIQDQIDDIERQAEVDRLRGVRAGIEAEAKAQEQAREEERRRQMEAYDRQERDARDHFRQVTEAWRLEAEARQLIFAGEVDQIEALIAQHVPGWATYWQSFAESVIDGPLTALRQELTSIMGLLGSVGGTRMADVAGGLGLTPHATEIAQWNAQGARLKGAGAPAFVLDDQRKRVLALGGIPSFADGGFLRSPALVVAGDRTGGEHIFGDDQLRRAIREETRGNDGDLYVTAYLRMPDGALREVVVEEVRRENDWEQTTGARLGGGR